MSNSDSLAKENPLLFAALVALLGAMLAGAYGEWDAFWNEGKGGGVYIQLWAVFFLVHFLWTSLNYIYELCKASDETDGGRE